MSMDSLKRLLLRYKFIVPLPTDPVVSLNVTHENRRYPTPKEITTPALYVNTDILLVHNP